MAENFTSKPDFSSSFNIDKKYCFKVSLVYLASVLFANFMAQLLPVTVDIPVAYTADMLVWKNFVDSNEILITSLTIIVFLIPSIICIKDSLSILHAKEDIIAGNKLYVILNRAGGYRRGLVVIRNFHVFDVIFEPVLEKNSPEAVPTNESHESHNQQPAADPAENDEDEEIPEDFGLIAFQWVEATIMELNEQVNEAIGRKENSFLIPSEDLPVKESWPDICKELARNDLSGAICHENGIQIEFEQ